MRVIAGSARGRRLRCFKDRRIRPTSDRVTEAVFSSLMLRLPGSRVLDLFAGSGALGIEALSRGAGAVLFVEKDRQACDLIRGNLAACGLEPAAVRIIQQDAILWLRAAAGGQAGERLQYDIILADPPYQNGYEEAILSLPEVGELLSPRGILVLESGARQVLPECSGGLFQYKRKTYGDTKISYYTVGVPAE